MIKLKNLGTAISREEMKNVNGGKVWTCTFTMTNGNQVTSTFEGGGSAAQCAADNACIGSNDCVDADCAGSGAC